ncbi:PDR/VanB family oxidoreductase [Marinobacter sp. S6332]|uniref:PDR/VanB family oxidoreductase n=1 Tax=Marinobacter sp. S6332 TaxID=2926403 RepID=UPI001FF54A1B|nr:PDR/VanB family oxidoreductase [Marinobacter sp. S6332]MCK0162919.1 PDR/VanB family oxidoreductase [Marinobacter sp. S6332]
MANNKYIAVKVANRTQLNEDIVKLTLVSSDGTPLPAWEPGAHIELQLSTGNGADEDAIMLRHYSLCGDYNCTDSWEVAVLREQSGRGGSAYIHEKLKEGDVLQVSGPRNHFPFKPGKKVLFIAGGIGITPILPMIQQAETDGIDWRLVYLSRERSRLVYVDRFEKYDSKRIRLNGDVEDGFCDLVELLNTCDSETTVYSCGPKPLLDALENLHSEQKEAGWSLTIERFTAKESALDQSGSFDVVINSTGKRVHIPEGQSILETLRDQGIRITCSCRDGVCGTCETGVLSGLPDHRDSVLSEEERADNDYMMVCVSRAHSEELVLDL